jgi:hypothetical protein
MKRENQHLELVRFFVPVLLFLLTVRILYFNGGLSFILFLVRLPILFVVWVLAGGVPSLLDSLILIRPVIDVAKAWFKFFTPDDPRVRGRQLSEPRPASDRSLFSIRPHRDDKTNKSTTRRKSRVRSTQVRP